MLGDLQAGERVGSITSRFGKWARAHASLFGEKRRPDPKGRRKSSLGREVLDDLQQGGGGGALLDLTDTFLDGKH